MPRPRRLRMWLLLAVPAVITLYLGYTLFEVGRSTTRDDRDRADAIIVLGAAQYDGRPSPVFERRLDHALELYEEGVAPEIVLTGGKQPGDRFTEAFSGFTYLRNQGVPDEDLLIITDGANTWESLAAAARQLDRLDQRDVVLVSDPYHNQRLLGTADDLGLNAGVSATDADADVGHLLSETGAVAVGRLLGYRRLLRFG
ncbi:MAG: YdcF family protein [Microthrixaceae bacterium]|nr:YdcF family protein [Microthrixaceae bacterium]